MSLVEGIDYLDIGSEEFIKIQKESCVYLLAPEFIYKNGVVKVGIAQKLGQRIGFYRSAYAWFSKIFIFGLIIIDTKPKMRSIEKEIFKIFSDIRIPFMPFKGRSTKKESEWLIIDVPKIKKVFDGYKTKGFKVILKFDGLNKAPMTNLDTKVIKKLPKGKYLIEFHDGSESKIDGELLRKTVNMPPLKMTDPTLLKWITQEEADKLLNWIVTKHTRVEILREGGLYNYYDELLKEFIEIQQRKQRKVRFKLRQSK